MFEPTRQMVAMMCAAALCGGMARAGTLIEPPSINVGNSTLIKLEAARKDGYTIDGFNGTVDGLLLYSTAQHAPSLAPAVWKTQPGRTVKVELTNRLPCLKAPNDSNVQEEIADSDYTNLHVHGLVVSPNSRGPWLGDNSHVMVKTLGTPCAATAAAPMAPVDGVAKYKVALPNDHHYGLSWYHPHVHGVAGAQVAGGMSGLISIGDVWSYAYARYSGVNNGDAPPGERVAGRGDRQQAENLARSKVDVKHLMLKDMQLEQIAATPVRYRYRPRFDPGFCGANALRDGVCDGVASNSKWLFMLNGSVFPSIDIAQGRRHVWRLANVGATVSYELQLRVTNQPGLPAGKRVIPLQVLVTDGVALPQTQGSTLWRERLTLMPSARVEVHVDPMHVCRWLDLGGSVVDRPGQACTMPDIEAVLETIGPVTYADKWPKGALAKVRIAGISNYAAANDPGPMGVSLTQREGGSSRVPGAGGVACANPSTIDNTQYRLIGLKNEGTPEVFGMVTEGPFKLNEPGFPRATAQPYRPFDPMRTDLCIGADIRNKYSEVWVIRNEADEIHNFHIHQSKFEVMSINGVAKSVDRGGRFPMHDNFPISRKEWIQIRMTFDHPEQAGRFMYHCHILEHEDKGMMSNIQVVDISNGAPIASSGQPASSSASSPARVAMTTADERLAQYRASAPPWMADSLCTPKTEKAR